MENQESLSRNILLFGDITSEKIESIMQYIIDIVDHDDYMSDTLTNYEREPIKLYICSGGGEVMPTIGLCEYIAYCGTPIATICLGEACSAAFMLLIAGHRRYAVKGSSLMAHQMAGGAIGSAKDCEIHLQHMKKVESYMIDLIKETTELPQSLIDEIYSSQIDKFMTVEEALEYKVIDCIYGQVDSEETDEEDEEISSDEANINEPCNT